ncbi:hypothetical protein [Lysinibacillus sp. fls2-241-R2A-57]|nr:hypothetical protein [Lysinibacillus sp. fls2-241-R2A-57]
MNPLLHSKRAQVLLSLATIADANLPLNYQLMLCYVMIPLWI